MIRELLIDGDVLLYEACHRTLTAVDMGDDVYQYIGDAKSALSYIKGRVHHLVDASGCDTAVVCVSGDRLKNFRYGVESRYKENRNPQRKPVHFPAVERMLKAWCDDSVIACFRQEEALEADDLMGIYATQPGRENVICTIDKDLTTIPGEHFHMTRESTEYVHPAEAELFFYLQILMGDTVDDIKGCPGIGPVKARKLLTNVQREGWWPAIVAAYEKAGQTEDDAIRNARLVRILQCGEYDFNTKEVRLWEPA